MPTTKEIGDVSEAMAVAAFLRAGLTVLTPFGDNKRYDMVIERDGVFYRVQSKTARLKSGTLLFDACSSYCHRGRGKKNYRGDVEFFSVYAPEFDKVYVVPVKDVPKTQGSLRVDATKNGQKNNVRWARDYEFTGSFPP